MASLMCLHSHFSVPFPYSKKLKTDHVISMLPLPDSRHSVSKSSPILATSSGKVLSISLTAPCFTSNPKIPGNFFVGTVFLSLILSALVSTLKLIRKRRSLPSRLSLIRYRFELSRDFLNVDIYNLKKKFLMDLRVHTSRARQLGTDKVALGRRPSFRPLPLARGTYGCGLEVPDQALIGFLDSRIIEPSFPVEVPFSRESVGCRQFQSLMVWEFYIMGGSKTENFAVMHIATIRTDFGDVEEEEKDMFHVNDSGDRRYLLPEASIAPLKNLPLTTEEKEELPASNEVQAAIPAIAMVAGVLGALVAGDSGCLEMVGFVAISSFVVYDLLWASRSQENVVA
ncbi:uncharacterized protein [Aristolochia californica]|uniref:uncharacterized protein isoform X2 n=1 Tax=Aristolochia californica TaxID=171875 RepID=UPI0035DBEE31